MKQTLTLLAGIALSPLGIAQVPSSVFDSCVLAEDYKTATYQEFTGDAVISDDEIPGHLLLIYQHKGSGYGYASGTTNQPDLLVVGRQRVSILTAKRTGNERPEKIDPTQAIYGIVHYNARAYYCVASNFEGLGRSGSFQNIRVAYVAPLSTSGKAPKMSALYYTVRDIRKIGK
ncbi:MULTISPECIES: hypothetical protein [Cupriavidus]|jgi:hypothetical protein|uniref:Uncharacterized protein n=1 Tax=Cupriavidus metallidurans TaxID=119219 RepID=A0A2L0X1L0_9BURK|nr:MULTISPECIES: hypothetical protein [Cupriavidus]AVA33990.1 hypothetical protein C3Z06_10455 [Cupriavidus metallidurans]KWR86891.1 hypothetical protein RN01_01290 [Cupriavidus sp. SHE]QBP12770.1 hypothetical protein DDF84_024135 [Cupriavidus metallidurans]QWC90556.1 hypothetical protein KB891_23745 [Cupriavidus metallidurans]